MSRKFTWLEAFLLSQAAAWSAVGCLTSAFQMPVEAPRELGFLLALAAGVCVLLLSLRRGGWLLLAANAAAGWLLWRRQTVRQSVISLLSTIVEVYDSGYGWGMPEILKDSGASLDPALLILGILLMESVCLGVCRRRGTMLPVAALAIPLAACLVVTDTVPDARWLYGLLLCLALLFLTDSVRLESGGQGTKLALSALIPTALALGLLLYLVPQNTYVNKTEPLRQRIAAYLQELPQRLEEGQASISGFTRKKERVELDTLSAQSQLGLPVAELAAEEAGTVYLRVKDYDRYTGSAWLSTEERQETLVGTGNFRGSVVVRELSTQSGMLIPAYPEGEILLEGGVVHNLAEESVYRMDCMSAALGARPGEEWLALPEETRAGAVEILQRLSVLSDEPTAMAQAIGQLVRESAVYDRNPSRMEDRQQDFALWFLEEADRGYCVHFATAAAVLLRGAGIPARYVTGYKVEALPGVTSRVTSNDAHAWVEYYNYNTWSWSILEATPASLELTPKEEQTEATQMTQPQTQPEASPETSAAAMPSQPAEEAPIQAPKELPVGLFAGIGLGLLAAGIIEFQRVLRLYLRKKRQSRGDANRRAMEKWKELTVLTRLVGRAMPKELTMLAEKAAFSQHLLEPEEVKQLAAYAAQCRRKLRKEKIWKRLAYRYWYAVI